MNVVTLNGFDVEECPQGGLQLTSVPISKNTTFGVSLCVLVPLSLQAGSSCQLQQAAAWCCGSAHHMAESACTKGLRQRDCWQVSDVEELAHLLRESGAAFGQQPAGSAQPSLAMQPGLAVEGSQKVLRPSRCSSWLCLGARLPAMSSLAHASC